MYNYYVKITTTKTMVSDKKELTPILNIKEIDFIGFVLKALILIKLPIKNN